jgi:hypothetical protein
MSITTGVRLVDLLQVELEIDDAQADLERHRVAHPDDTTGAERLEAAVRNAERRRAALRSCYWN